MADSWEDEEFDLPSAAPPTTVPVSWEDEVRLLKLRRSSRSCPLGLLQGKGEVLTSGYIYRCPCFCAETDASAYSTPPPSRLLV